LNRVMEDTHRVSLKAKVFQDKQEWEDIEEDDIN
jgi:hypothetical protein